MMECRWRPAELAKVFTLYFTQVGAEQRKKCQSKKKEFAGSEKKMFSIFIEKHIIVLKLHR